MSAISVITESGILTNPQYWIGKIYDSTSTYMITQMRALRKTAKIPRTDDFREVQAWQRTITKNVNSLSRDEFTSITNALDDPMYWIERRKQWQLVL